MYTNKCQKHFTYKWKYFLRSLICNKHQHANNTHKITLMRFYWRSFHTSSNMLASSAVAAYLRPHLKGETFLRHQSPSPNVSIWPPTRCFTSHNSSHRSGGSRRRPGGNRWGDNVWKTSLTRSVGFYFTCWRISPENVQLKQFTVPQISSATLIAAAFCLFYLKPR